MQLAQPNFQAQKARVEAIAKKLGIPLQIINLQQEFEQRVLDYFSGSYFQGLTPNPCVICNREIKFGLFMEAILGQEWIKWLPAIMQKSRGQMISIACTAVTIRKKTSPIFSLA